MRGYILLPIIQSMIYGIICGLLLASCGNPGSGEKTDCVKQGDEQIAFALAGTICSLISVPLCLLAMKKTTRFQKIGDIIKPADRNHKTEFDVTTPLNSTEDALFESIYGIEYLYARMLSKTALIIGFHLMLQLFIFAVCIYEIIVVGFAVKYPMKAFVGASQIVVMLFALVMIFTNTGAIRIIQKEPEYKLII